MPHFCKKCANSFFGADFCQDKALSAGNTLCIVKDNNEVLVKISPNKTGIVFNGHRTQVKQKEERYTPLLLKHFYLPSSTLTTTRPLY